MDKQQLSLPGIHRDSAGLGSPWGWDLGMWGKQGVLWVSGEVGARWVKELLGINEIWIWQNIFDRNKGR